MANQTSIQLEREFIDLYKQVQPETMVDLMMCYDLYTAVRYVVQAGIGGALAECGVWRGGCSMLMALTAARYQAADRDLFLYDTYTGMTEPCEHDVRHSGEPAHGKWQEHQRDEHNDWCFAPLEQVRQNMARTGYPQDRVHLIKGPVEETIPQHVPDQIALLRLDTDFYESTYHELVHLYPRLAPGGVVILDDYTCWQGQRRATNRYFTEQGVVINLTLHSTGASGVKVAPHGLSRDECGVEQPAAARSA